MRRRSNTGATAARSATALLACMLLAPGVLHAQGVPPAVPLDTLVATAGSRVVAGAAAVTRSIDVLTRAQIDALPARSVSDVVARALGADVQARSAAQADLSIRGSSFEQVLVLVDGVPVNDDQTGHFHLDLAVPLDAIERVEVLRGPASALYGSSAVGGVVNIVTRRDRASAGARVEAGSWNALSIAADASGSIPGLAAGRAASRPVTARVSASHDRGDGHRDGTEYRMTQARAAADAAAGPGTVAADVAYAVRDFGASGFYANADSREETRTATASLSYRPDEPQRRWTWAPRVSFRQHDDDFILRRDDPAFYRNLHQTRQLAGEVVARYTPSEDTHLAFGAEAARSGIESASLGNRHEDRAAVFAEFAAGSPDDDLFTGGIRVDRHSQFGVFVSPTVAGGYRIGGRTRLRASAGTGFRAPTWTDRFYEDPANIGNPDLGAERFWTGELGADVQLAARTSGAVTVFLRQSSDLIDWARPTGAAPTAPWRTRNVTSATFRGLEAMLHTRTAAATLTARASLLSFDAEDATDFASKYALRPLTRALSAEAGIPFGPAALTVRVAHHARAGAGDLAGETWTLVDTRLSATLRGVELYADATNVLGEEYLDVTVRPAPGRALAVGLRVRR